MLLQQLPLEIINIKKQILKVVQFVKSCTLLCVAFNSYAFQFFKIFDTKPTNNITSTG